MTEYQPGDVIWYDIEEVPDDEDRQYGVVESIASDGDIRLKFARNVLHKHEHEHGLIERTGDPELAKGEAVDIIQRHTEA